MTYLESRLSPVLQIRRLFRSMSINRICSAPIATRVWGIEHIFPGREQVLLFDAMDAYVGPIAGDKAFSRRMSTTTHTLWVISALERLATLDDASFVEKVYARRGIGGLSASAHIIWELSLLYHSLTINEQRTLWVATLLHDIGKATGNREKHPAVGAAKLELSPAIMTVVRAELARTHTDAELAQAEELVKFVVAEHDMVGGLAITRDRNLFECAEKIKNKTQLVFAALVNFADIDGQGDVGIFTNRKLASFFGIYQRLLSLLEQPGERSYPSFGKERFLAWSRGDTPGFSDEMAIEILEREIPDKQEQVAFLETLGRISLFDGMYNFSTKIHDPVAATKFLVWCVALIRRHNLHTITYDNEFLTNDAVGKSVREAAARSEDFSPAIKAKIEANAARLTFYLTLENIFPQSEIS